MSPFSEHAQKQVFHIVERDSGTQLWISYCPAHIDGDALVDPYWELKIADDSGEKAIRIKQSEMLYMVEKINVRIGRDIGEFNSLVEYAIRGVADDDYDVEVY